MLVLQCHSATVLQCYSATVLVLQCHSATVPQCHSASATVLPQLTSSKRKLVNHFKPEVTDVFLRILSAAPCCRGGLLLPTTVLGQLGCEGRCVWKRGRELSFTQWTLQQPCVFSTLLPLSNIPGSSAHNNSMFLNLSLTLGSAFSTNLERTCHHLSASS